jgi:hypothetical protein
MNNAPVETVSSEDLQTMPREQLLALIAVLANTIQEIAGERDAALLLNELCHY